MSNPKLDKETLPKIALGTWSWGTGYRGGDEIFGNQLSEKELRPVFETAVDKGLVLWDTAAVYGLNASETILGNFVKEAEGILISTKFTPQLAKDDHAVETMIDGSLERLEVPFIDIYWIHNPLDVSKWTEKMIPLLKKGKIKHIGVSNHNLEEIKLAAEILAKEDITLSAVQNHYSLLYRASEQAGILEYCAENEILFFSYMVLEQGALTEKYSKKHPMPAESRRGNAFPPRTLEKIEPLITLMKEIGLRKNANVAQIAIAWAIAKNTIPIIGVTKVAQVEDAYQASSLTLSKEEIVQLESAASASNVEIRGDWEKPMNQ